MVFTLIVFSIFALTDKHICFIFPQVLPGGIWFPLYVLCQYLSINQHCEVFTSDPEVIINIRVTDIKV